MPARKLVQPDPTIEQEPEVAPAPRRAPSTTLQDHRELQMYTGALIAAVSVACAVVAICHLDPHIEQAAQRHEMTHLQNQINAAEVRKHVFQDARAKLVLPANIDRTAVQLRMVRPQVKDIVSLRNVASGSVAQSSPADGGQ